MSKTIPSPRQGPRAADVVQLLKIAFPKPGRSISATTATPTPATFRPRSWPDLPITCSGSSSRPESKTPPPGSPLTGLWWRLLLAPVEIAGDLPVQRVSVELEPGKLSVDPVKTSCALAPTPSVATVMSRTTKAELLSRAKAAIEAGESSVRDAAEALALAQNEFNATQREMAEAVGRSASWVNRLLKWRRSGYMEYSPFGPTTKAGRVAHAQQRTKVSKPRKPKATTTTTSADAEPSSSSADASSTPRSHLPPRRSATSCTPSGIGGPTWTTLARSR